MGVFASAKRLGLQAASVAKHVVPSNTFSKPYENVVTRFLVAVVSVVVATAAVVVAVVVAVVEKPSGVGVIVAEVVPAVVVGVVEATLA